MLHNIYKKCTVDIKINIENVLYPGNRWYVMFITIRRMQSSIKLTGRNTEHFPTVVSIFYYYK